MAVIRQFNVLGQERIDVPHLRSIESAIAADFDVLVGMMLSGKKSMILSGFKMPVNSVIGAKATSLQVVTAGSLISHYNASETGTIFFVPADRAVETLTPTNPRVLGSFTANTVNYIGLDVQRTPDDTTADTAMFLDADTLKETPKTVPLGRTLDYVLVISTTDFTSTPSVAAIAKVTTDASNNVVSIVDARELMFRLGTGGSLPDLMHAFPWPEGRLELTTGDVFSGGDKPVGSLKSWMDAVMTRIWEIGGGERWFSSVSDRNVKLVKYGTFFTNGEYFSWDGTNLLWKGLKFVFPNSTGWFNDVADQTVSSAGLTDLADGECIYVDLDYTANRTGGTAIHAAKTTTILLGSPTAPGTRHIIAWRVGSYVFEKDGAWPVGSHFNPATTVSLGVVALSFNPTNPAFPIVLTNTERDRASGVNATPGGVAGLWRTNASWQYDVLGTGLFRGANQGSGTLHIGRTANDQTIFIGGNDQSAAGAGVIIGDAVTTNWVTQRQTGVTLSVQNSGVERMGVTSRGNVNNTHNVSVSSINTQEDVTSPLLTFTSSSGFEDVVHIGAGAGTVTPSGNSGGQARDICIKVTTSGAAGGGTATYQWSFNAGLSYNGIDILIPAGASTVSDGVVVTFAGNFAAGDVYNFRPRFVPQATHTDNGGRIRGVVDHNGYTLGRHGQFREDWMYSWNGISSVPTPSPWAMTVSGTGSVTNDNADSNLNAPYIFFSQIGSTAGDTIALYTNKKFAYLYDDITLVSEWECITASGNNVQVQFGLRDANTLSANGVWFQKNNGGNWICYVSAGGVSSTANSGVSVPGENTIGRMRIEILGKNVTGNPNRTARFWINEALVAEVASTNIPVGPLLFSATVESLNNGSTIATILGPIQCVWNRMASAPAL